MSTKKPYQKLAWLGSVLIVSGSILAAFNIYPAYVWVFLTANLVWTITSVLWREPSLVLLNGCVTLVYVLGLILK